MPFRIGEYETEIPIMLIMAVYKSFVGPAIMYGGESWCLNDSEMEICEG